MLGWRAFALIGALIFLGAACARDAAPAARTRTTSAFDVDHTTTTVVAQAALCFNPEARSIATAYTAAMRDPKTDVAPIIANLRQASDVAPEELRDEFATVLGAQIPFLEMMGRSNGNLASLARDASFRDALSRVSSPAVLQASAEVSAWVAQHCAPPR